LLIDTTNDTLPLEASHFSCTLPQPLDFLNEALPLPSGFGLGESTRRKLTMARVSKASSKAGDTACRSWLRSFSASTVQTTWCEPVAVSKLCVIVCGTDLWGPSVGESAGDPCVGEPGRGDSDADGGICAEGSPASSSEIWKGES
jgi:hypothetical protein